MAIPRIVIGHIGGGVYGMKCSLPGINALTNDDNNPALFSFSSRWSNTVRVGGSGFVNMPGQDFNTNTSYLHTAVVTHGLGVVPFHEVRSMEGSTNCIHGEFGVAKLVDNGNGGYFVLSQRLQTRCDSTNLSIDLAPWSFKLTDGSWYVPSPPLVRVVWTAYIDPHA